METKCYAEDLKSCIDAQVYTTMVLSLGSQLNDRKNRFDKADIIEQTIESASDHRLRWVDDFGRDHNDSKTNFDIEFKYQNNGIFTKTGRSKKTIKVKLKNSLGKNKGITIKNPADFYILGQQDTLAIISWNDIKEYLVGVSDGIEAHIPFEKLEFIFTSSDVNKDFLVNIDYMEIKRQYQKAIIEYVKRTVKGYI